MAMITAAINAINAAVNVAQRKNKVVVLSSVLTAASWAVVAAIYLHWEREDAEEGEDELEVGPEEGAEEGIETD
ncbi:hypothetical protein [Bifidobacterium moraviense]|nr:hypothetical protein [Bifidobacterium sp. DSM 109958]